MKDYTQHQVTKQNRNAKLKCCNYQPQDKFQLQNATTLRSNSERFKGIFLKDKCAAGRY